MSAIVLTSVGQAMGGPLGALTGSLVGSVADRALTRSADVKEGNELRASYGTVLPALFGRNRTAGTLIWAQPMRRTGGGKGGGQRSYVTSLAIALSTRRVMSVGRIWADGRPIRALDGTSEFDFAMRLRSAGEAGDPDPLLAAIEGLATTPGYRGLSIIVLEDFPLAPFGNRIPALEFEVLSDAEDTTATAWMTEASGAMVAETEDPPVRPLVGWPLTAPRLGTDLDGAIRASGLIVAERSGALAIAREGAHHEVAAADILLQDGEPAFLWRQHSGVRAMSAAVSYADPERDYQQGDQQVFQVGHGEPVRLAATVAMTAQHARALASAILQEGEARAAGLSVRLSWKHLSIVLGDRVSFEGQPGTWLVVGRSIENFGLLLDCVVWTAPTTALSSDHGRANGGTVANTRVHRMATLELPASIGMLPADGILLGVSAGDDWAGAELMVDDGGQSWSIGFQQLPVRMGRTLEPLLASGTTLWDERNDVLVRMDDPEAWLENRTGAAVLDGANLARCGSELLQFRDVEPLGEGVFRLSGLLRGRYGTRPAEPSLPTGADILFVEPMRFRPCRVDADLVGRAFRLGAASASGIVEQVHDYQGLAYAPFSPCHLSVSRLADGSLTVSWVRRDRHMLEWAHDGAAEGESGFRLEAWRGDVLLFERRTAATETTIAVTDQLGPDGVPWSNAALRVIAEGNGPLSFRASDWVALNV